MENNKYLENAKGHLKTVLFHKWQVFLGCAHVGLYWQGIVHDLSKFTPEEFRTGVLYYQGTRSPNAQEREEYGYSIAWMHHKGRNKHHFEYWTDAPKDRHAPLAGVKMPPKYLAEMVMDRIAASKAYNGKNYHRSQNLEYLMKGRDYNKLMHPDTFAALEECLTILSEKGERAMYRHVRKILKNGY